MPTFDEQALQRLEAQLEQAMNEATRRDDYTAVVGYAESLKALKQWRDEGCPPPMPSISGQRADESSSQGEMAAVILQLRALSSEVAYLSAASARVEEALPPRDGLAAVQAQQEQSNMRLGEMAGTLTALQQSLQTPRRDQRSLPRPAKALLAAALLLGFLLAALTALGAWQSWQANSGLAQMQGQLDRQLAAPAATVDLRVGTQVAALVENVAGVSEAVAALGSATTAAGANETAVAAAVKATTASLEERVVIAEQQVIILEDEQANYAASATQAADTIAALQAVSAQATAQASELITRETALATAVQAITATATAQVDLAAALNATATALAVTPTPSAVRSNTPVPTLLVTKPTSGAAAAQISGVAITFPADGAALYTEPWQVAISANPWPEQYTRYRLLVDSTVIAEFDRPTNGGAYTIEREIVGNWDQWPGMNETYLTRPPRDANGQLQPGSYRLRLLGISSQSRDVAAISFIILPEPPQAKVVAESGIAWRPAPSTQENPFFGSGAADGSLVAVLGKVQGNDNDNPDQPAPWCFWQALDDNPRRGWSLCKYLEGEDGVTLEYSAGSLPILAPWW